MYFLCEGERRPEGTKWRRGEGGVGGGKCWTLDLSGVEVNRGRRRWWRRGDWIILVCGGRKEWSAMEEMGGRRRCGGGEERLEWPRMRRESRMRQIRGGGTKRNNRKGMGRGEWNDGRDGGYRQGLPDREEGLRLEEEGERGGGEERGNQIERGGESGMGRRKKR